MGKHTKSREKRSIQPGDRFNSLVAIKYEYSDHNNRAYFLFRCDCGNEKIIGGPNVACGNTKGCGCLVHKERKKPDFYCEKGLVFSQYKRMAKDRNIEFHLSRQEFENLIKQNCHYCDSPPSNLKKGGRSEIAYPYNGVDRVDSSKGYFIENVVPCCAFCNYAKGELSVDDFLKQIDRISEYQRKHI